MKVRSFFSAGVLLAVALIFSCSSDDDGGGGGSSGGGELDDKGNDIGSYKTVVIGTQTWMAENLNYAVTGSKCYGEGGEVVIDWDRENRIPITTKIPNAEVQANCEKYGRLYDWVTAMALPPSCNENSCSNQIQPKHKGICPSGWHIPSHDDWEILMDYVGDNAETKLKAKNGWSNNGNGTDEFEFSALPGGIGVPGGYGNVGNYGHWWSATEIDASLAYFRFMSYYESYYGSVGKGSNPKSSLFSVRCVKD